MNIYKIERTDGASYDEYDSAVVIAPDEEMARRMNPGKPNGELMTDEDWRKTFSTWVKSPHLVEVNYLGRADEGLAQSVIVASFNAG
jgi:hypothetical protein